MNEMDYVLQELKLFSVEIDGIGGWITPNTNPEILSRLARLNSEHLPKVQLNQLLVLGREAPLSDACFDYYWRTAPDKHPYDVKEISGYDPSWFGASGIVSLEHLKWGLTRLFTDSLLYFGDIRTGYRKVRALDPQELSSLFERRRFDTELIKARGPALPMKQIPKDDRYLISEMACKSYGDQPGTAGALRHALFQAYDKHKEAGGTAITIRSLLSGEIIVDQYKDRQGEFIFSADDVLDVEIVSEADLGEKYDRIATKFFSARTAALANTNYYLSMASDLDVYVATSMRTRQDFRSMASTCETIFGDPRLHDLQLRYFDPTLSAAEGHEDKGLIECLMVKCAKVLVYSAGEKESWGKDAEAAMALSLGKPVIFYCDQKQKTRFYRDVHPLSRLIEFETGVAVGAMVTSSLDEVSELLFRLFENKMQYRLEQPKSGHLRLREAITDSVVRLQT